MKKRLLCATMVLIMVITAMLPSYAFAANKETPVSAAKNAVVRIMAINEDGDIYSTGSAFAVGKSGSAPEYFVTNAHCCLCDDNRPAKKIYILLESGAVTITNIPVILGNGYFEINSLTDVKLDYSKMVECDIVNRNSISLFPDVAVLKAVKPVEGKSTLKLAKSSDDVREAQTVHTLGFPGDMDDIQASSFVTNFVASPDDVTFTSGTVMKKMKNVEAFGNTNLISHTAQIASGNSGGPLLDENGAVIGINTYGLSPLDAGTDGNYYFSVYIDYAREILDANDIRYETAGGLHMDLRTIVMIAAMVLIAALAVFLVLFFIHRKKEYLERIKREQAGQLRIQGVKGYLAGRRFPLVGEVSIGRAPGNNIVFPTTTKGVSGNHCVVINRNGQIYVKDVSSQGTFLNGTRKLTKDELTSVKVGDRIALGSENETFMITYKDGKLTL